MIQSAYSKPHWQGRRCSSVGSRQCAREGFVPALHDSFFFFCFFFHIINCSSLLGMPCIMWIYLGISDPFILRDDHKVFLSFWEKKRAREEGLHKSKNTLSTSSYRSDNNGHNMYNVLGICKHFLWSSDELVDSMDCWKSVFSQKLLHTQINLLLIISTEVPVV